MEKPTGNKERDEMLAENKKAREEVSNKLRAIMSAYMKTKEDFTEKHFRKLIPGWALDYALKHLVSWPISIFGVHGEILHFPAQGIEVLIIYKRGRIFASEVFFPPQFAYAVSNI